MVYCRFVHNIDEVKAVISKLYENRKIANATHNMYAYRIIESNGKSCVTSYFNFFVKSFNCQSVYNHTKCYKFDFFRQIEFIFLEIYSD